MADEFTFIGSVSDSAPKSGQKGRVDRRMVRESVENLSLSTGDEFVLVDAKERGDLYEVRVVSDNPYLEVYIELDDYRNENTSAAELLAQPNTGRLLSNFQVIDGESPSRGYTLLYNPDIPEDYQGRIRIVLRNRIRPNNNVFGNPTGGSGSYRSRGDLASPTNLGFSGGAVIPHNFTESNERALTGVAHHAVSSEAFNNVPGALNMTFLDAGGSRVKRGALHPYVGTAGTPVLSTTNIITADPSAPMVETLHIFFDEITGSGITDYVWPRNTRQDIYIVDIGGKTIAANAGLQVGQRIWFKDRNNIYFAGEVTAFADSQTLPTRFAANGGSAYTGACKVTVAPGLASPPPTMVFQNYDPTSALPTEANNNGTSFGSLTTPADNNPTVQIYSAEVRRLKRVSFDG